MKRYTSMSFIQLAKKRYSSRNYKSDIVETEKLMSILEAARIAPSASNKQPWVFIIIKESENLKKLHDCYQREWFRNAPLVIIACANHKESWKRSFDGKDHAEIDLSIAIDHMTLAATDLGLATCWICHFDVEKCISYFNLPEHIEPIALLPVAYPNDAPDAERHSFQRKKMNEIVRGENY